MQNSHRLLATAVLTALALVAPALAGSVSAAKSRIMQAQDDADKDQKDDALAKLAEAETFLDGLSDDEKAPVAKQIADLRAKLGTAKAAVAAPAGAPPKADTAKADPEATGQIRRNIERYLSFAEGDADTSASDATEKLAQAVEAFNADDAKASLSADVRATLQARIDSLQSKLKAVNGKADAARFTDRVERNLHAAQNDWTHVPEAARRELDEAGRLLASDEAKAKLGAPAISKLKGELADAEAKFADYTKHDALQRADPLFKTLEEKLTTNPFKQVEPIDAYKVTSELRSLTLRIEAQLNALPEKDSDRKASADRLAAAQAKIDAYDAEFAAANADVAVVNGWELARQGIDGWGYEDVAPSGRAFAMPDLPKTERAAKQAKYFLDDKSTVAARGKAADFPKATAAIAEAEKTLADAQAKLHAAFEQWMDAAEKQPRPQGPTRFEIGAAANMERWADERLAGAPTHDADVARAKRLDQRWQDELAALKQQHEAALKKMTADASAAWPAIAASIPAVDGFHPGDVAAMKGKTFRFNGVRNRAGWDFDGRYDLVIWVDGTPVAGNYEPAIRQAFADAAHQIGDSVDDHIDWDVIATIEGTGNVNQRFKTEVKDEHRELLGTLEGTRPVDCVTVRVIAVHAGPIATSAK